MLNLGFIAARLGLGRILFVALMARVAAVIAQDLLVLPLANSEHWQLARNLVDGRGFAFDWYGLDQVSRPGSFLPPLYAWVLAGCLLLAGRDTTAAILIAQAVNVLLGVATVVLVARLAALWRPSGDSIHDPPNGESRTASGTLPDSLAERAPSSLAALVWAVYPPALGHTAQPQTQVLETCLTSLSCLVFLRYLPGRSLDGSPARERLRRGSQGGDTDGQTGGRRQIERQTIGKGTNAPRAFLLPGIALGLLLLARPPAALAWAGWSVLVLWPLRWQGIPSGDSASARRSRRLAWSGLPGARLRYVLFNSLVAALILLPWTLRNLEVHGRPVPIATNGGFNFYLGNNAQTGGGIPPLPWVFNRFPEETRQSLREASEIERDRWLYGQGARFWREDPARAWGAVGRKLIDFVAFRPYLFQAYPPWQAWLMIGSYAVILLPFAFALALSRCRGEPSHVLLVAIGATLVTGLIFIVSMRFRAAIEPLMLVIAATAWWNVIRRPKPVSVPAA